MIGMHPGGSQGLSAHRPRGHGTMPTEPERFLRLREVVALCGLPASSLYDSMRRGTFPKPVPLAGKSVAWLSSEIQEWMRTRIAARQR